MITVDKLKTLTTQKFNPALSIYIPTSRAGRNLEDQLHFKNALSEAHQQLVDYGYSVKDAHRFLNKGYELLDDENFWLHLSDGLALFLAESYFEYFIIPIKVNDRIWLSQQFYIRPLIPLITQNERFFLLALSQNEVRFFEGNRYSISPVIIEDLVPSDMETALNLDIQGNTLRSHSTPNATIFHGQGGANDQKLVRLRQFFQQVDDGLMKMLHDEKAPLLLASVDHNAAIYRKISNYTNIVPIHIGGNPEEDDPILLHEKAWRIMQDQIMESLNAIQKDFDSLVYKEKASADLDVILQAAPTGRIKRLYIDKDVELDIQHVLENKDWAVDLKNYKDAKDLLELLARQTFLNGGEVLNVTKDKMPQADVPANALLRY